MKRTQYIVPTQQIHSFTVSHLFADSDPDSNFDKEKDNGGGDVIKECLSSYNVWDEQW